MTGHNKDGQVLPGDQLLLVPETQIVQCRAKNLRYLSSKGLDAAFELKDRHPAREIDLARGST